MNQFKKAVLLATSAAKMGTVSTYASADCGNSAFGVAIQGNSSFFTSSGSKSSTTGTRTINAAKLTSTSTLDFTISGIEPVGVSTVYIAYSTTKAPLGTWPASCKGQLELSSEDLEIVYGTQVDASQLLLGQVSMGTVLPAFLSYTLSIRTDDLLANNKLKNNRLYFQALVVKGNSLSIPDATISPIYEIQITRATSGGGGK